MSTQLNDGLLDVCPTCDTLCWASGDGRFEYLSGDLYQDIKDELLERVAALERENAALRAELQPRLPLEVSA